ncbi:MAG: acyl-CoA dehydrogenase family protein, partial [Acidimicrobiales bacterium]
RGRAHPTGKPWASRLGPFVSRLDVDSTEEGEVGHDVLLHLTLTAWQVLGTLERAVELAVGHVKDRVQFNKPLSAFQAVQFQLADASVAVTGLRQLCQFTLWRVATDPHAAIADALAVRLAALDSARTVLRTTQQLFGASGLCDEYDISILVRHVQPALRLPWGADHTAEHLARAVRQVGFDSLFPHGATRP